MGGGSGGGSVLCDESVSAGSVIVKRVATCIAG